MITVGYAEGFQLVIQYIEKLLKENVEIIDSNILLHNKLDVVIEEIRKLKRQSKGKDDD